MRLRYNQSAFAFWHGLMPAWLSLSVNSANREAVGPRLMLPTGARIGDLCLSILRISARNAAPNPTSPSIAHQINRQRSLIGPDYQLRDGHAVQAYAPRCLGGCAGQQTVTKPCVVALQMQGNLWVSGLIPL